MCKKCDVMKKKLLISCLVALSIVLIEFLVWFLFFDKKIVINLNGETTENLEVFSNYEERGITAYYKNRVTKGLKLDNINISNNIDNTKLGEYSVNYEVNYQNQKKIANRKIVVIDDISPTIEVEESVKVCPNINIKDYKLNYNASDNYDGDITNKVIKSYDSNKIYLEVTDSSFNKTVKSINVDYEDNQSPIITLAGGDKNIYIGTKYSEPGFNAIDNCDGDITDKVIVEGNVNINKVGTYQLKYSVTDSNGNKSEKIRKVTVYDKNSTPNGQVIYLTFDDGPCIYTGKLLDILKGYNVKATFFVTGQFGYDSYIKREYEEGHSIGIHTYSHLYKNIYSSVDAYFDDLYKMRNKIYNVTGYYTNLVRFPGGSSNTISKFNPGVITKIADRMKEEGYVYFDWNVASQDTGTNNVDKIANNIIKNLHGRKYYIILQHDIKPNSIEAVKQVIEYGLKNGYEFRALDINSPTAHHEIAN